MRQNSNDLPTVNSQSGSCAGNSGAPDGWPWVPDGHPSADTHVDSNQGLKMARYHFRVTFKILIIPLTVCSTLMNIHQECQLI